LSEGKETFSKILVAIDGSEASVNAADYAIQMTREYNSELIALHVILSDLTIFGPNPPRHINELKQEAQKYLDKIREKLNLESNNSDKKIQLRTELIASASAVGGIVGFAEKENTSLIVIGTRGRSGFKKLLLGSVAAGVVKYAHCPVMVIK
jgi:nucleotide-binding universal stress UspA family protein